MSVPAAAIAEGITMDDPDNNFLVALSALASTKEITGYAIPRLFAENKE